MITLKALKESNKIEVIVLRVLEGTVLTDRLTHAVDSLLLLSNPRSTFPLGPLIEWQQWHCFPILRSPKGDSSHMFFVVHVCLHMQVGKKKIKVFAVVDA